MYKLYHLKCGTSFAIPTQECLKEKENLTVHKTLDCGAPLF